MKDVEVSVVIFYDDEKNILIQDRTDYKSSGVSYGFWGGGLEENETKEQALVREIKEELDYDLKEYMFIGTFSGYNQKQERNVIMHTFISRMKNISDFNPMEGAGMKLVDIKTAEKLLKSSWEKEAIEKIKETLL